MTCHQEHRLGRSILGTKSWEGRIEIEWDEVVVSMYVNESDLSTLPFLLSILSYPVFVLSQCNSIMTKLQLSTLGNAHKTMDGRWGVAEG